jgi:membrane protein
VGGIPAHCIVGGQRRHRGDGSVHVGGAEVVLQTLNLLASVLVTTLLFASIYKVLPKTPIAWRDVWEGALLTSILFAVGKLLIGLYIGKSSVASAFGSAGPFVALMVWIYYSTQVFLFGAEVTCVVARGHAGNATAVRAAPVPKGTVDSGTAAAREPVVALPGGFAPSLPTAREAMHPIPAGRAAKRLLSAAAAGLLTGWATARIARARTRSS